MTIEVRDPRFTVFDENENFKLYTFSRDGPKGITLHYWIDGKKQYVLERILKVYDDAAQEHIRRATAREDYCSGVNECIPTFKVITEKNDKVICRGKQIRHCYCH